MCSELTKRIAQYTKYQREKNNYSLHTLARKAQVNASYLLRLEQGYYQSVKMDIVERLASAFDMSIEEFLRKCTILAPEKEPLPSLEFFLKEKYQFPPDAIEDAKLFIEMLESKHKSKIKENKQVHERYWSST